MKKFIALLAAAVLIVSTVGVMTAFAGCSISGNSEVYAGKTYTYKVKVSANGVFLMGNVVCGGVFSGSTVQFDAGSGGSSNQSLSTTATITVTVSSSAKAGDTGTISISNGSYSYYDDGGNIQETGLSGSKTVTVVTKPTSTSHPATSSGHSTAPATPTPAPTGWALAGIDVPALAQGGTYNLDITDDSTVPAGVLMSLKEKQGVLNVNFGAYTCIIDGASLGTIPEDLGGINLAMSLDTDEVLSQTLGGADIYQLHFAYEGELPGKFTYRFPAMANQPGDTVYLYYYYDKSGVVEGKQACVVDTDGYITVSIYHCSTYFISGTLIEGAAGIIAQPEPVATPEPTVEPTQTPVATPQAEISKPVAINDGLAVSASGPVERWFGVPYAPLIVALVAAALLSMLLTMLFTRSGLFRRKPKAVGFADYPVEIPKTEDRISDTSDEVPLEDHPNDDSSDEDPE
jgi:hypothetical protein